MSSRREHIAVFYNKFREAVALAFGAMWTNRTRSALTVLGIFIGVTTVVGLISLIAGLTNYVASVFAQAGTDTFMVMRFNPVTSDYAAWFEARKRPAILYEDAVAIASACPSVDYTTYREITIRDVTYRGKTVEGVVVIGTTEEFQQMEGLKIRTGRFITNEEVIRSRAVCGLASEVREQLFGNVSPVGEKVKVGGYSFTVVGDAYPLGSTFGQNRDNTVIVPITTFKKYFGTRTMRFSGAVIVKPRSTEEVGSALDEVTELMRRRHRLRPEEENDFEVVTQAAMMQAFNALTAALFVVIVSVAAISLLVGGVGIMNIMLVSVTERTREIGIRKAVGACRGDVLMQFLIEAVVLSGSGGVLGIIGGTALAFLVDLLTPIPASVSPPAVALGVTFSSAVGLFFGLYPARRAASLEPIAALRYE